jgi:betaine-aldehyde dehydrogenase
MSEIAKHWIDGEWTGSGTVSESVNPATGAVLGRWADGGEAEARAAIAAARRAFDTSPWSRDRVLRRRALSEMADRFDAHAEELGTLVTKENGKKIAEGLFEGSSPGPTLRHNAAQALIDTGIAAEVAPGQWFSTYAEPAGVVGVIVPWNSPVALLIRSLAPALSAGNTVVVKMPGQTALVATWSRRSSPRSPRCPAAWSTSSPNPATPAPPTWSPPPTCRSSATPAAPQSGA